MANLSSQEVKAINNLFKFCILLVPFLLYPAVKCLIWLTKKIYNYFFPPKPPSNSDDGDGGKPGGGASSLVQVPAENTPSVPIVPSANIIESSPADVLTTQALPDLPPLSSYRYNLSDNLPYEPPAFQTIIDNTQILVRFLKTYPAGTLVPLSLFLTYFTFEFETAGQLFLQEIIDTHFSSAISRHNFALEYGDALLGAIDEALLKDNELRLLNNTKATSSLNYFSSLSLPAAIMLPILYKIMGILLRL